MSLFPIFGGVADRPATVTQTDQDSQTAVQTTFTFSGKSFGTASTDRKMLLAINSSSSTRTISSVTIGGVSATSILTVQSGTFTCAIFIAAVPTGTTGDVVITFSGNNNIVAIGLWACTAMNSTAHATASDTSRTGDDTNISIDVPANGIVIAHATNNGNDTYTWTNLTEEWDEALNNQHNSGGSDAFSTLQSGRSITATQLSAASSVQTLLAASFGPA